MSAAINAKSAKSRATIALHLMDTVHALGNCRGFDDCFEMGDGDDVVREIRRRAKNDTTVGALVRRRGYGYWLAPDYISDAPEVKP